MTTRSHINPGNILLRWASEQQAGQWHQFRQAAATCLSASQESTTASVLATRMSDLGHLDINWETEQWSVAPPILAVARGMGMCVFLAGWRTNWLESRFDHATNDLDIFPLDLDQRDAPTAKFAKCGSMDAIEGLAEALHVDIVWDPSAQLGELVFVRSPTDLEPAAMPFSEDEIEMFDSLTGRFNEVSTTGPEGLYRYEVHGRQAYRLHVDGDWRIVDRATGMLNVLRDQPLLRWHKSSPTLETARAVTVPSWLALPTLAERALVAATGMLPVFRGNRRVYRNVTRDVAQRIASALDVRLEIADTHLPINKQGAA